MNHWRDFSDADDDDDSDDSASSETTTATTVVPHKRKHVSDYNPVAATLPIGMSVVEEIDDLREKRRRTGYYASDGTTKRHAAEDDINALYGEEWLQEEVARRRLLGNNPWWYFLQMASGGSMRLLDLFVNNDQTTAAVRRRISTAKAALLERRRAQQDTRGEQERVRELKERRDKQIGLLNSLENLKEQLDEAKRCYADSLDEISQNAAAKLAPKLFPNQAQDTVYWNAPVDVTKSDNFAEALFDYFTRAAVANFGAGGFAKTGAQTNTIVQLLSNARLDQASKARDSSNEDKARAKAIVDNMPQSATAALYWAVLLAVYNSVALLEIAGAKAVFDADSEYFAKPSLYAEDLVTLGSLVFREESPGTDNLLQMANISLLLWAHINRMIGRGASLLESLPRPVQPIGPEAAPNRSRRVRVNNTVVEFDVPEEDLGAAASGQDVPSIDQSKLRELQRTLFVNLAPVQMLPLVIDLLKPMFDAVYGSLFYTKQPLDLGGDEEAFAGGFFADSRVRQVYQNTLASFGATNSFVAVLAVADAIVGRSIKNAKLSSEPSEYVNEGLGFQPARERIWNAVWKIVTVTPAVANKYRESALERFFLTSGLADCLANYLVIANQFGPFGQLSASALATLTRYVTLMRTSDALPGSTADPQQAELERAFLQIYRSAKQSAPARADYAAALFKNSHKNFDDIVNGSESDKIDARVSERIGDARVEVENLSEQAALIEKRIKRFLEKTIEDDMELLQQLLSESFVPSASEALAPQNSGVLFFTNFFIAGLEFAVQTLKEFAPCLYEHYTVDELVSMELYKREFAKLISMQYRLNSVRNPDQYTHDASESRGRLSKSSALGSIQAAMENDSALRHCDRCKCEGRNGPYSRDLYQMAAQGRVRYTRYERNPFM